MNININGIDVNYIEEGDGDVILMLQKALRGQEGQQ